MTFIDILLGILLIWGLYKGLRNGLIIELASIIALIAGLYGAFHLSYLTADFLNDRWEWDEKYVNLIAFLITFGIIVVLVNLIARLLTQVVQVVMLGWLNRLAGAIFGALKVAVILGAFLIFFDRVNTHFDFLSEDTKKESVLYGPIRDIGAFVFGMVFREGEQPGKSEPELYFTGRWIGGSCRPLDQSA